LSQSLKYVRIEVIPREYKFHLNTKRIVFKWNFWKETIVTGIIMYMLGLLEYFQKW